MFIHRAGGFFFRDEFGGVGCDWGDEKQCVAGVGFTTLHYLAVTGTS